MSDLLTTIQLACFVLLAIGGPAYAVLRLKWRAEAAEYALRNERLKSSRLEREIKQLQDALAEVRRVDTVPADPASHSPAENAERRSRPSA